MISLLLSDYLIWGVFLTISFFIIKSINSNISKNFYKQLFSNKAACVSIIVLVFYLIVSLADSIHFKDEAGFTSLFDRVVAPIGTRDEISFSKPMATKSFVNKTDFIGNKAKRVKPNLIFVKGQSDSENIKSFVKDFFISLCLIGAMMMFWAKFVLNESIKILTKNMPGEIAYRTIFITIFLAVFLIVLVKDFSSHYYIFGTDKTGLEVLYLGIKSIRTGLALGVITILFMVPLATIFGISAGYFGGKVDSVIQYIYTTLSSIPGVLLIAASVLSLDIFMNQNRSWFSDLAVRSDFRLVALCLILGVTGWTSLCRLLRGEVLKLRELDFIVNAKVLGLSPIKIMWRHILPNVMHIIIITSVLDFSGLVLAEAVLSYLGVGVDPTMNSWGNMINAARLELSRDPVVWWPLLCAISLMFMLVLSVNVLSDKIRNLRDPRRL